jgi:hypothetical protein
VPLSRTVELQNFSAVSDETFPQVVRSRTEPQHQTVAQLSRVAARFDRPIDFDIKSHLQDAIAGALDTYFSLGGDGQLLPGTAGEKANSSWFNLCTHGKGLCLDSAPDISNSGVPMFDYCL